MAEGGYLMLISRGPRLKNWCTLPVAEVKVVVNVKANDQCSNQLPISMAGGLWPMVTI